MEDNTNQEEVKVTMTEIEGHTITPVGMVEPKPVPTTKLATLGRRFKSTAFMRFMVWLIKRVMVLLWPTKIFFKERFNIEGKAIVTCNHYGSFDTNPIIHAFYKNKPLSIMLKKELMEKDDFKAHFLDEIGGIPVNRHQADVTAVKRALRALSSGQQLLIYPEGTRNRADTKQMGKIEEGTAMFAIKAKAPIIPLIYYRCTKWNRKNYMLVGHPFTLEEFYEDRTPDVKKRATAIIVQKYAELRAEIDEIVEVYKGSEKKYKKAHGMN
ncbi:MAG: 1-acyl-sn-glycerol-3-phosphate acyltransferase [Clostridia bacterium]|nr:1-acyl-sn-glycerol-3-phosphate acyltransferase [Clostridia bacterium]